MSIVARTGTWLIHRLGWSNTPQAWRERGLLIGWLLGVIGFAFLGRHLSEPLLILGGVIALVILGWFQRQGWVRVCGPVLFYEMVRAARRKQFHLMRFVYACTLALILGWVYFIWCLETKTDYIEPNKMAELASSYFYIFMMAQILVVYILTPAYVAGSIAEEKEKKTLEFLLATDLHNREIVLGKHLARLGSMVLFLLAGLPVLSLMQLFGGIDPMMLLAGFALTGLSLLSLTSLSILVSTLVKRPRDAIVLTYLTVVAYLGLTLLAPLLSQTVIANWSIPLGPNDNPWFPSYPELWVMDVVQWLSVGNLALTIGSFLQELSRGVVASNVLMSQLIRDFAIFHIVFSAVATFWAVLRVRGVALRQAHGGDTVARSRLHWRLLRLPRLPRPAVWTTRPMLWKEFFIEGGPRLQWFGRIALALLVFSTFVPAILLLIDFFEQLFGNMYPFADPWSDLAKRMNVWLRAVGTVVGCLLLIGTAVRASGSIRSEHDRQTLDALLTSPMTARELFASKWLGCICAPRWGWMWLFAVWGLCWVFGGVVGVMILPTMLCLVSYAALIAALGLWFSTIARTTSQATIGSLLSTAFLLGGHWLVFGMCCVFPLEWSGPGGHHDGMRFLTSLWAGMTPPVALVYLPMREFTPDEVELIDHWPFWGFLLLSWMIWTIGALMAFDIACNRFQRSANRHLHYRRKPSGHEESPATTG